MYDAQTSEDLKEALDEYISGLKILPREWSTDHKIEPPANVKPKITNEMEEDIDEDRRLAIVTFAIH